MSDETILWRRLDRSGHDICRLEATAEGYRLWGTAVFRDDEGPAHLRYDVEVGANWCTRSGRVTGWFGERPIELAVRRVRAG